MRTPAGQECRFYFEDYYRGRSKQECRLLAYPSRPERWTPDLCRACPVPAILRANACPNMVLEARIEKRFLGLRKQVRVDAFCLEHKCEVAEPMVGCGHCHEYRPGATMLDGGKD